MYSIQDVSLVKPTINLKNEYLSFYKEWRESGEQFVPWIIGVDPLPFENYLTYLENNENGVNIPEGWVSDSTFWLVTNENLIVGAVNIRHKLTEHLTNSGGHIGYGIVPSQRQKGYATVLLSLSLLVAKKFGIDYALVVCDASNIASKRTILKNNGIQDKDFVENDGNVVNRFWIET